MNRTTAGIEATSHGFLVAASERTARLADHLTVKPFFAKVRRLLDPQKLGSARKPVIAVVGGTVLLIGIALIVLPGPAFVVIPIGLAILATVFLWAKRWLQKARSMVPRRSKHSSLQHAQPAAPGQEKEKVHRAG